MRNFFREGKITHDWSLRDEVVHYVDFSSMSETLHHKCPLSEYHSSQHCASSHSILNFPPFPRLITWSTLYWAFSINFAGAFEAWEKQEMFFSAGISKIGRVWHQKVPKINSVFVFHLKGFFASPRNCYFMPLLYSTDVSIPRTSLYPRKWDRVTLPISGTNITKVRTIVGAFFWGHDANDVKWEHQDRDCRLRFQLNFRLNFSAFKGEKQGWVINRVS